MKDYTELLRGIRMFMHEAIIGYWKTVFALCLIALVWRITDPQGLEVVFKALGWIE